jgi:hypothetical protein
MERNSSEGGIAGTESETMNANPDPDSIIESEDSSETQRSNAKENFFKNITVEPMMLAHMIGMACSSIVVQNMYLDRICRITYRFPADQCANLTATANYAEGD